MNSTVKMSYFSIDFWRILPDLLRSPLRIIVLFEWISSWALNNSLCARGIKYTHDVYYFIYTAEPRGRRHANARSETSVLTTTTVCLLWRTPSPSSNFCLEILPHQFCSVLVKRTGRRFAFQSKCPRIRDVRRRTIHRLFQLFRPSKTVVKFMNITNGLIIHKFPGLTVTSPFFH